MTKILYVDTLYITQIENKSPQIIPSQTTLEC